jgi:ABC-type uncharacterized transport system involved in gliding motility auxiliary subunit
MEVLYAAVGAVLVVFGLFGLFAAAAKGVVALHLGVGLALVGWAAWRGLRRLRALAGQVSGGLNSVVQAAIVIVIGGLLAFVSVRHPKHWDVTEAKEHSLAQGTLDTLAAIPKDGLVEMYAFFTGGHEQEAKQVIEKYTYASPRVKARYLDTNSNPGLARRFEISNQEGVVIVCDGPCETAKGTVKATDLTEQSLTRAIRQAVSTKKKIYFLSGHGEADPDEEKAPGASAVKGGLQDENATVAKLLLANEKEVPADADAVIIAGPDHAVSERELELLDAYLTKGGSLLVMVDPAVQTNLEGELAKWGVEAGPEVVVEQQLQLFAGPKLGVQPVVTKYGSHPITQKLNGQPTLFSLARPLKKKNESDGNWTELATTSPQSFAEADVKDLLASKPVVQDPSKDRSGPFALAMARELSPPEGKTRGGRLVVVGDSDFMRNRFVTEFYNGDLFLNMTSWLTGSEDFVTIDRKRPRAASVNMTIEQFSNFRFLALFAVPELILMVGLVTWARRRV